MLRFINQQGQLMDWTGEKLQALPDDLVFLDLLNPTRAEEVKAELWLEHQLPTREEMQEIEESSRLYQEGGTLYMTAWVPIGLDTPEPETSPISFVLEPRALATIRYADPMTFRILGDLVRRQCTPPMSSDGIFLLIVERIVGRIADALQAAETDLRRLSRTIFSAKTGAGNQGATDLNDVVKLLGRRNELVANLRECLVSISRMLQFFLHNAAGWMRAELAMQFRSVMRDVKSLDDYTNQQTSEMTFLLDATLGLINNQQNQIIKILTVASLVFMPPTVLAGIYGMNVHLPLQDNPVAFWLVMVSIILSGVLPIVFLKWRKLL